MKPLCIDLFCGLGGWTEGFLAEGYRVIGFDIEQRPYPGQLVLQDIRTLHGAQLRDAAVIVASSPCQEFSYRAMPWKRAKALPPPVDGINLFYQSIRIQHEAQEAAGRQIPLVMENVRGAQPWVGYAAWHYGSYYLWGDIPALMPSSRRIKAAWDNSERGKLRRDDSLNAGSQTVGHVNKRDGYSPTRHLTNQRESDAVKQHGSGPIWFDQGIASLPSHSTRRKEASAQIAKIPFPLAQHIARVFKPEEVAA